MKKETTIEKTKICGLNLGKELLDYLKERFDVFEGTLGKKVDVSEANIYSCAYLLFNGEIPDNIQEYEVFVEDMQNVGTVEYDKEKHIRKYITEGEDKYFTCYRPQTIFNPIPYGSHWLNIKLHKERKRPCIKVVFLSEKEEVEYIIQDRFRNYERHTIKCNNYEHVPDFNSSSISGLQVKLCESRLSERLFGSFLNDIRYNIIVDPPTTYKDKERVIDEHFLPLLETSTGAVVSYIWLTDSDITIALPQTTKKKELLKRVFEELLYIHFSGYFPEVEESAWLNTPFYYVPGKQELLQKKAEIQQKYEDDIKAIDQQIIDNQKKYEFLHALLTETGDELVTAMITFLKWLGFTNVIDRDTIQEKGDPLEEDIDVDMGAGGLLVIEVKGIGGTSTDAQCSQIHKIVHRRCKERGTFDVRGLYIVNNEMHIEPLQRTIPPFTKEQLQDAVNDERGLAYSWQFFYLYFNIENGFITKEEARKRLFDNGLISFSPNFVSAGIPYNYYKERTVACIELNEQEIIVGDSLCYETNGRWERAKVVSIEQEGSKVDSASHGRFGFGLDKAVPRNKELYIEKQ